MTIEDVEKFWSARPCNVRHSSVDIDEDPARYSWEVSWRKREVEPHIEGFADFPRWYDKKVLDLGCGIGTDAIDFATYARGVYAVDVSEESIKVLEKRVKAIGLDNRIQTAVADIEKSLFPTSSPHQGSFDLVYSFGVIHHTPRPAKVVFWAMIYLKPGGVFKLMLYNRYSWKVLCILLANFGKLLRWKSIDKVVALESEAQTGCPITWTFTRKKARDLLESQGFIIQDTSVEHIFPYKVQPYKEGRYVKAFPWNIMPLSLFRWLEHKVGWHLCITAIKPMPAPRYTPEEIMEKLEVIEVHGGFIIKGKEKVG